MSLSKSIQNFLKLESTSGFILFASAILAMLIANSPLRGLYAGLLQTQASVSIGALGIAKPILLWINDGLMAIFFLLIGLEVKREILDGELSDRSKAALPLTTAIGGMVVPSAIYVLLNIHDPTALNGWAIPAATDIAFALGVLTLLGNRVPESLKVFLLALAIIDDLAAIGIIAVFYSGDLSLLALGLAAASLVVMLLMNRAGVSGTAPYLIAGLFLWVFVLKSGVHATLAGVATAFAIPLRVGNDAARSPLRSLEHALHPWVAYGIMPIFAFANAGLSLADLSINTLFQAVPLGIILGLVIGKPVGVTLFSWMAIRLGIADLPEGANWTHLIGVGMLCGVGFTMSLFIASLAFEHGATEYLFADRFGILVGSLLAGALGYATLRLTVRKS
ncbi:MAG TPA: Na+/H+ antiporter NhaA [Anaerolineae bacterium]|nr:Na+/H+ antiporter NhaA [Anaerolineae bacterium]